MSTENNKVDARRAFEAVWNQKNAALLRTAGRRGSLRRPAVLVLGFGLLLATLFLRPYPSNGLQ